MAFIVWSDTYSVGNTLVDSQHQKLVEMINLLYDELNATYSGEFKMQEIFNELLAYSMYHFNSEEQMMMRNAYPGLLKHLEEHSEFISKISSLKLNAGESQNTKMEVFKYLKGWLLEHILHTDKETFKVLGEHP